MLQDKIRVLLVEPEKTFHKVVDVVLGDNYKVTAVTNRVAALNEATEGHGFDLVITNGDPLGGLDAFIAFLRAKLTSAKIILMTGYEGAKDRFDVDGFIAKPYINPLRHEADTLLGLI